MGLYGLISCFVLVVGTEAVPDEQCVKGEDCGISEETSLLQASQKVHHRAETTKVTDFGKRSRLGYEKTASGTDSDSANNDKPAVEPQQGNKAQDDTVNKLSWGSTPRICIKSQIIRRGNGERFRRNNAAMAKLGAYGGQDFCVLCSSANFHKMGEPKADWITADKIEIVDRFQVDSGSQGSIEAQVNAAVAEGVRAHGGISAQSSGKENIQAQVVAIKDLYEFRKAFNEHPEIVTQLATTESRPRIVVQVMVLTADSTASNDDCAEGTAGVAAVGVVNAGASGSACSNSVSIVNADTIVGYTLVEPTFNEEKTQIEKLEYAHACHNLNMVCQCQAWR